MVLDEERGSGGMSGIRCHQGTFCTTPEQAFGWEWKLGPSSSGDSDVERIERDLDWCLYGGPKFGVDDPVVLGEDWN